jgi:hypothetical protein
MGKGHKTSGKTSSKSVTKVSSIGTSSKVVSTAGTVD